MNLRLTLPILSALLLTAVACGGADSKDDELAVRGPNYTRTEDGTIIRTFDIDGDGRVDVFKYFQEFPDPDDPAIVKQRMMKKEVDVNSDGKVNIRREYNERQVLAKEWVDLDLDGEIDVVNHFGNGKLVKKELLDPKTQEPTIVRYYSEGEIERVERDTNDDEAIDHWEYYERGVLDRIGRDLNGDGRADTWQTR